MLVDPALVQLTEVCFREDGTALGLVHGGAEQVFHVMYRHDHRRPAVSKAQSRFLQQRLTARWQSPHSM